jgi:hypothetical protein
LPGFSLKDSSEVFGDTTDRVVSWKGDPSLIALSGVPVRLRFVLSDSDLYAFRFASQ